MNETILKYLSIIISWPFIALILVGYFLIGFENSIKIFVEKHSLKKAGPFEFDRQDEEAKVIENAKEKDIQLPKEKVDELDKKIQSLSSQVTTQKTSLDDKDKFINYLIQLNEIYEFSYWNLFFVQNTKAVLHWFSFVKKANKDLYNLSYKAQIPSDLERETILNVLVNNLALEYLASENVYQITGKGSRFLKFIGLIR